MRAPRRSGYRSSRRAAISVVVASALVLPLIGMGTLSAAPRIARTWLQVAELRATPPVTPSGPFGKSVAVSGDVAVVGANGINRAYVFEHRPTGWQQVTILGAGSNEFDRFGESVAVANTTIVVGAPGYPRGGRVYVYRRGAGTWHLWQTLRGSDTAASFDDFGQTVSVADHTIAVGAPTHGYKGMVYVFHQRPNGWRQIAEFHGPDTALNDDFGDSVSLATQFLVVGAPGHNGVTGAAYVYSGPLGWSLVKELQGRRPEEAFGTSVSVSGETAVVGAPGPFETGLPKVAGRAYVFTTFPGVPWHGMAVLHGGPSSLGSFFGYSVAVTGTWSRGRTLSPRRIVVGAYTNLHFMSPTYVYASVRHWSSWAPIAHLTAQDLPSWSLFGQAVAVSGGTALVSAPSPRDVGRVYVYRT
jgi:FG-GAP repeat protein